MLTNGGNNKLYLACAKDPNAAPRARSPCQLCAARLATAPAETALRALPMSWAALLGRASSPGFGIMPIQLLPPVYGRERVGGGGGQ